MFIWFRPQKQSHHHHFNSEMKNMTRKLSLPLKLGIESQSQYPQKYVIFVVFSPNFCFCATDLFWGSIRISILGNKKLWIMIHLPLLSKCKKTHLWQGIIWFANQIVVIKICTGRLMFYSWTKQTSSEHKSTICMDFRQNLNNFCKCFLLIYTGFFANTDNTISVMSQYYFAFLLRADFLFSVASFLSTSLYPVFTTSTGTVKGAVHLIMPKWSLHRLLSSVSVYLTAQAEGEGPSGGRGVASSKAPVWF